ncbi:hypothetical protein BgiBS90_014703, partial [Biomphalaria glabrata]
RCQGPPPVQRHTKVQATALVISLMYFSDSKIISPKKSTVMVLITKGENQGNMSPKIINADKTSCKQQEL